MNLNGLWKILLHKIYSSQIFKVMRLIVLFMMLGICFLSAKTYSQQVSYEGRNVLLEDVLKEFSRQTGYYLFYKHNEVKGFKVDHIETDKANLEQAMQLLLNGLPFNFNLEEQTIIVNRVQQTDSQPEFDLTAVSQQQISGVVRGEKGEALAGATVAIKGTSTGTMTDIDGEFEIPAEIGQTLVVSLIGYLPQEITVGDTKVLTIALAEEISDLDEVVVVGYGTQKKVNLTDAVSQISGEDFEQRPVTQLTQALQGASPNLNVTFGSGRPGT